jgi:hypothetical protein
MMNEPRAMREIHEIREKIYEETKHMTPEEQTELTRREAQYLIGKYGLKVRRPDPPLQRKII